VGFGQGLSFRKEAIDLVSPAVDPAASQDVSVVGEGGGLSLPGQIDAEDESIVRDAEPAAAAFLLFTPKTPSHHGSVRGGREIRSGPGGSDYLGHGRLTSHGLGDDHWDIKPVSPT